jgi:hypothetical protein
MREGDAFGHGHGPGRVRHHTSTGDACQSPRARQVEAAGGLLDLGASTQGPLTRVCKLKESCRANNPFQLSSVSARVGFTCVLRMPDVARFAANGAGTNLASVSVGCSRVARAPLEGHVCHRLLVFGALLGSLCLVGCGKNSSSGTPTTPTSTATRVMGLSGNLSFGSVIVGNSSSNTFTVTNSGNSTMTVTGFTGPCGGSFTVSWTGGTISSGASQTVTIQFTPVAGGNCNGTLTVNGDQTSGTNTLPLTATGVAAYSKNLSGTWRGPLIVDTVVLLTQAGTTLSGEYDAVNFKGAVSGSVSNTGQVTFTVTNSGFQAFTFMGQADDAGNTISGQVNGSGFNNQAWILKRQ